MRVEAPVAGAKGLMQRVDAKIRATLPRQARVTRIEGNSVWVKFLGDGATDPESKFPSTVAGVPPATMGWVITLGGKKGLFVATGVAVPITFTGEQSLGAVSETTAISGDPTYVATATVTLQPGTWRISVEAEGTLWRSANGGARVFGVSIDEGSPTLVHDLDLPALRTTPLPRGRALNANVVVASARNVTVRYGFRGAGASGSTYCSGVRILATATRIG